MVDEAADGRIGGSRWGTRLRLGEPCLFTTPPWVRLLYLHKEAVQATAMVEDCCTRVRLSACPAEDMIASPCSALADASRER